MCCRIKKFILKLNFMINFIALYNCFEEEDVTLDMYKTSMKDFKLFRIKIVKCELQIYNSQVLTTELNCMCLRTGKNGRFFVLDNESFVRE